MHLPRRRVTIRRLMTVVAFVALLPWVGMACHQWIKGGAPGQSLDPFDTPEMAPSSAAPESRAI